MAKQRHSRSRRHRSKARSYKGGSYTSASSYGTYVNGTPESQFSRTFDATGPYASRIGSEYVGAQGQWSQQPAGPSAEQLNLVQSAGKRKRKSRRGGFFGEVINQAIVPFALLGLQQTYKKKTRGGRKTRRH
jgi:hypothetical protein